MGDSGGLGGLLPLVLLVLLFVWFISRQRKQQREVMAVQDQVHVGSEVMMASGIYGEVVAMGDDGVIEVEVAPGVRTRWRRQAVVQVIAPDSPAEPVTDDVSDDRTDRPPT